MISMKTTGGTAAITITRSSACWRGHGCGTRSGGSTESFRHGRWTSGLEAEVGPFGSRDEDVGCVSKRLRKESVDKIKTSMLSGYCALHRAIERDGIGKGCEGYGPHSA